MPTLFIFTFALLSIGAVLADLSMVILHNNDMHAKFEETSRNSAQCSARDKKAHSCLGGFARTAHVIRQHRHLAAEGKIPPVLFLNAGDIYTGSAWFSVHKWKICVDFMNALKPDALSLGNHELDAGIESLIPFINYLDSPVVVSNMDISNTSELNKIQKSVVIDVNGTKVGIIGYLAKETAEIANTNGITLLEEIDAIREESEILDQKGVKVIIALGHSGFQKDLEIAEKLPLVDIVIGGHSNTFLYNGSPPDMEVPEDVYPKVVIRKSGKRIPVVQAYAFTKYLGRLNVTFNEEGDLIDFTGQPIFMSSDVPEDESVLKLLEEYRPEVDSLLTTVVGKSKIVFEGGNNICRFRECTLGNFMTDSYVAYVAEHKVSRFWTAASIGLTVAGGIRNDIIPSVDGSITKSALLEAQPFGYEIFTCSIAGIHLMETLELSVRSNGETSKGEFLQVSGIHVVYNLKNPVGHRIVSVKVRCSDCLVPRYEPVQMNKTYNIVTIDFLINGGCGHVALQQYCFNKQTLNVTDMDVSLWYFRKYSPVFSEIQGRIEII